MNHYLADPKKDGQTVPVPSGPEDGLLNDPAQVGGYPVLVGGAAAVDSDADGMPDARETTHELNRDNAADAHHRAANGHANLENYLNELAGDGVRFQ